MKQAAVTQVIIHAQDRLRKSERKVADFVLNEPNAVVQMRIVDLANAADVSEPTVVRFCRAVGYNGFQDFKLNLVQQLASAPSFGQVPVTNEDTVSDYIVKMFDSTVDALVNVRDMLNSTALERAINAISAAERVEFFGFGASGIVAADAHHKFFRLQILSAAYSDHHIQHMSARSMKSGDVVVAISQSGRSTALLESVEVAKKSGATVISISPSSSPLSQSATISVDVDVEEDIEVYTPLVSRITHLMVIDVLAVGVAQRRGDALNDHLFNIKQSLQPLRSSD
ncbi:SIS domain-containing protein [Marinibactrum halimedae]|uniref:Transcriptional regulator n=1 Tax=Marinibactrum halimedae TaxID=1444977 RepID=A0AA37WQL0_9GAMM|nr:SIS domain-containing protein [Marinibactrum halimedae]MCD9459995.1 SIS domain-containing protein [Marinibactrum halimedae]GLS28236.1 transcriptional regulator [Marinibactrum halimedae]